MQVGDAVRYEGNRLDMRSDPILGLVTRVWRAETTSNNIMCEVWWSEYDTVGLHFTDELELLCKQKNKLFS